MTSEEHHPMVICGQQKHRGAFLEFLDQFRNVFDILGFISYGN